MSTTPINARFYYVKPEEKSIATCTSHGKDHAAYRWTRQIDPRWSNAQKAAYHQGYDTQMKAAR